MKCQTCGTESDAALCVNCSAGAVSEAPPANAPPEIFQGPAFVAHDELKGIGGWLLFFCISLTILTPLKLGRVAATAGRNLVATPPGDSYSVYRLLLASAVYTTLAVLSLAAGLLLWTKNPKGVVLAKIFLVALFLIPSVLDIVLASTGFNINVIETILLRAMYPLIWFLYLQSSDRVQATYET